MLISREKFKDYLDIIRDLSDKEAKFNDILADYMILSLDNKRK